jgi:hypothetical protein
MLENPKGVTKAWPVGRNQTELLSDLYAEKPLNTEFTEAL